MEMGNAFKLAQIFSSYSSDLQIFINTHSPAFYSLAKEYPSKTALFLAKKDATSTSLKSITLDKIHLIDEEIGILPIISEYIKKEVDERLEAQKRSIELEKQIKDLNEPVIVTEGRTDVLILTTAWQKLFPDRSIPFKIIASDNRTDNVGGTGGYLALSRLLESVRPDSKIHIGLYDQDQAGKDTGYDKLSNNFSENIIDSFVIKKHQNLKSYAIALPVIDDHTLKFRDMNNLQIEFYFDELDLTKKLDGRGLVLIPGKIEKKFNGKILEKEDTDQIEHCSIKGDSKVIFAEYIVPSLERQSFKRFEPLFDLIQKILGLNHT